MSERKTGIAVVLTYVALGVALIATRLLGLGHGFWHDEITAVREYVREGPQEILFGPGLSHQLFSMAGWATSSLFGESEIAMRLPSVLPFLAGVVAVTGWLHRRSGALAGILFMFFATVSPLLLDITRQARGYGLGFLAMALVVIGALEAMREPRTRHVLMLCAGGLLGTMTLPNFAIAFLATSVVLLFIPELRLRTVLGIGATLAISALWYAPHRNDLRDVSQTPYGNQISPLEGVTAPFDQIMLPGLMRLDGETPTQSLAWLPLVAAIAVPIAMSPFLRNFRTAWALCAAIVASNLALVISGAHVVPRYASFLLVPAFVLLATGCAEILGRLPKRTPLARTVIVVALIALLLVAFPANARNVTRLPREAHRDAAHLIRTEADPSSAVYALAPQPDDLQFYLDRKVASVNPDSAASICAGTTEVVYVEQRWRVPAVDLPCLDRVGVRHETFEQYARGGRIDVWLIPPAP